MSKQAAVDQALEGEAVKKMKRDMHFAYKCSGSCAAATDRPFSCGAPDCDKKGVPLDKVEKPVVYFCDGDCKGQTFLPTNCGDKSCNKADVPLVAKVMCETCATKYDEDENAHACEECTSVIDVSQLPAVTFSTDVSKAADEKSGESEEKHYAYKCAGSCAAAVDREFKCGAETCDKVGESLDKVETPVVYFCDAECKGAIFTPTKCGDSSCSKSGVPLVAKVMCDECVTEYEKDKNAHACESCTSVIRTSKLPEIVFTTNISVA